MEKEESTSKDVDDWNNIGLRREDIYHKIVQKLGCNISDTVCSEHLSELVKHKFLRKDGKYYILTDKFKEARKLRIFGIVDSDGAEKKLGLQQFLIFNKGIYKAKAIPEKKLGSLLKYVNAKKKDLRVLVHVHANGTKFHEFVYKKILTVRVRLVQFVEYGKRTIRRYHYEEDGFSLQEVSNHLNQRTRTCHMFIGNNNYTDEEIAQNIELLNKSRYTATNSLIRHQTTTLYNRRVQLISKNKGCNMEYT